MYTRFKTNYSRNDKNNTILKYTTVINDCVFSDEIMLSSFQVFSVILVVDFSA